MRWSCRHEKWNGGHLAGVATSNNIQQCRAKLLIFVRGSCANSSNSSSFKTSSCRHVLKSMVERQTWLPSLYLFNWLCKHLIGIINSCLLEIPLQFLVFHASCIILEWIQLLYNYGWHNMNIDMKCKWESRVQLLITEHIHSNFFNCENGDPHATHISLILSLSLP